MLICLFWGIYLHHLNCQVYVLNLFVFFYYPIHVCRVFSDMLCFIPNIGNLCHFFGLLVSLLKFVNCNDHIKERIFVSLIFLYIFSKLHWFLLLSVLCLPSPSVYFAHIFLGSWGGSLAYPFAIFSNICIYYYRFSSKHCFSCITQILACFIFYLESSLTFLII